jgi:hypothetical protein
MYNNITTKENEGIHKGAQSRRDNNMQFVQLREVPSSPLR